MAKRKKDTGIIPGLGITEERRDQLKKRDWSGPLKHAATSEQYTTQDCINKLFSGIRINKMTNMVEIWCFGEKRVERNYQKVANNPAILATMHEEAFATVGTVLEIEVDKKRVIQTNSDAPRLVKGKRY